MTPYDPRAAALNALAMMRWPDVSEPPEEQVEVLEAYLRARYHMGALGLSGQITGLAGCTAALAAIDGRPLVPPA